MSRKETVSAEPVILGFLTQGELHPYELYRLIDRELGQVWKIGQSHLYAYLNKIAAQDYATVVAHEQDDRPEKHCYHLTPKGQERFDQWLRQPSVKVRNLRLELLAKIYFFHTYRLNGGIQFVASQKKMLQDQVALLKKSSAQTDDTYLRLVIDFRQKETEAVIKWLKAIKGVEL